MSTANITITALEVNDFTPFLDYLNDHLSDNGGADAGYFQPMSRSTSRFPADKADAFRAGMQIDVGQPGWRRVWVARDIDGGIAGHIDLRGHADRFTVHRCLLGMGVDRRFRQRGLGAWLLAHARHWAAASALSWIDLQVLSANAAARSLYLRAGFVQTGETQDMFRIDGQSFDYTAMSLRLIA